MVGAKFLDNAPVGNPKQYRLSGKSAILLMEHEKKRKQFFCQFEHESRKLGKEMCRFALNLHHALDIKLSL